MEGLHDIEVRYAHPTPFHYGAQTLLYAVLKEGQSVSDLLDPPKKGQMWGRPKKDCWRDHAELLVPWDAEGPASPQQDDPAKSRQRIHLAPRDGRHLAERDECVR